MTIVAVNRTTRPSLTVNQGSKPSAAIIVKKGGDLTLQSLQNVDLSGVQDGYTLVYDEETQKFTSQPIGNVTINTVDGGTF